MDRNNKFELVSLERVTLPMCLPALKGRIVGPGSANKEL